MLGVDNFGERGPCGFEGDGIKSIFELSVSDGLLNLLGYMLWARAIVDDSIALGRIDERLDERCARTGNNEERMDVCFSGKLDSKCTDSS